MNRQLRLPLPEPGTVWERIGLWLVGDRPEPRELVQARAVRLVAAGHRARVNAASRPS